MMLVRNQLGNYVIQKLVIRDQRVRELAEALCSDNFDSFCLDEYPSRVMQILVEVSKKFRGFVIDRFTSDPWSATANIASVFLASAVIKHTEDLEQVNFISKMVKYDLQQVLTCKYMKRILMTFCERASFATLDELFYDLGMNQGIGHISNNKILTYVYLSFLFRQHRPSIVLLEEAIKFSISTLLKTKFFIFLLERAIRSETHPDLSALVTGLLNQTLNKLRLGGLRQTRNIQLITNVLTQQGDDTSQQFHAKL